MAARLAGVSHERAVCQKRRVRLRRLRCRELLKREGQNLKVSFTALLASAKLDIHCDGDGR